MSMQLKNVFFLLFLSSMNVYPIIQAYNDVFSPKDIAIMKDNPGHEFVYLSKELRQMIIGLAQADYEMKHQTALLDASLLIQEGFAVVPHDLADQVFGTLRTAGINVAISGLEVDGPSFLIGSVSEGNGAANGFYSHAEGNSTASGSLSHAEGSNSVASAQFSHSEGTETLASGSASHAEGYHTIANGFASHAEGYYTTATGRASHAAGKNATAGHNNAYCWSDGSSFGTSATNQFIVKATGTTGGVAGTGIIFNNGSAGASAVTSATSALGSNATWSFVATVPSNWSGAPTTIADAINRLAAQVEILRGSPIP
jgi:hypothetical protein